MSTKPFDFFREVVDRAGKRPEPDIWVVGSGVRIPGQFTREGVEALCRCRAIYGILPPGGGAWFLGSLGPRVENLWHLYEAGRLRSEIYERVVATVLDAAVRERPIGYVTAGNPIVFDDTTRGILLGGKRHGLDVCVVPGISSIDTVLVDLQHDIAGSGLQIFGASWLVTHGIQPRVDVPCLLLQASVFGTSYATIRHEPLPGALAALRDHLLRSYPPDHEVIFVESPAWWHEWEQTYRVPLGELGSVGQREMAASSLFIPRLHKPAVDAPAFMARLSDPAHFVASFRPVS